MKSFTEQRCREINQLIAIHLYGYRWFYIPAQAGKPAFCLLAPPSSYIASIGGKQIDHPAPGDRLDIDVAEYHKDEDYTTELMEKCLEHDPESPLILHRHPKGGFYFGDLESEGFESIPLALADHVINIFNLQGCPTFF